MKQLRPEGITFADVWHSPAMPFDETDYRLLGALPDDVDGYLDNLVTERNETACRELQVGDLSPDTSMLLNDDIYAIMLKYSMTKHARDTAPDCRTRLFSETLGIEVGVKSADAGYALADSLIPDKDFTDDRLSHLRQLEGVDPTSRIPHVLAKELHNAGLELHFSSEEEQAFVSLPASYVAVRLKEGLDPAVLPSDKLVDIVTNYGRNATANAASFHDSYTWLANCFGQHLVEEATVQ
ncbi:MAG TPA: hypothetical protein VK983_05425, partial [Candidatus Limnocylindrales bacterium]|nr:hypothetical protein [Candidatus Limnocylindrales bacterium]